MGAANREVLRVLMGNDPRCYREAIAAALGHMCPDVEIHVVEPEQLDVEVARLAPELVVCSALSWTVATNALSWIVLYPDGERRADVSIAGERGVIDEMEFRDLLSVVELTRQAAAARPTVDSREEPAPEVVSPLTTSLRDSGAESSSRFFRP